MKIVRWAETCTLRNYTDTSLVASNEVGPAASAAKSMYEYVHDFWLPRAVYVRDWLFSDLTQRRFVVSADVSGQSIGPILTLLPVCRRIQTFLALNESNQEKHRKLFSCKLY